MFKLLIVSALAFLVAAASGLFIIPFLHRIKFGQEIREEGPSWHQKKSGTPTMGGFIFIIGMLFALVAGIFICGLGDFAEDYLPVVIMFTGAFAFGVIGFIDDYIKVILKRNLGLRAGQKFTLQFLVALMVAVWVTAGGYVDSAIKIPFTGFELNLGYIIYIPFIIIVMLAVVNSVNLTDGLDGLAGTVTLVVAVFYAIISNRAGSTPVAVFASSLGGGLVGFLIYNKFPAKVFMGDTGSLFLGGAVAVMAIFMGDPLLLIVVGLVYVAESLSVIIQVAWFKKTGKRIFKMSPIHHHFEMCGWKETTVVAVFTLVTAALCGLSLLA